MRNILNVSGEKVELNALFIQPSRLCAGNCKGCYVKAHGITKDYMDPNFFRKILEEILRDERLFSNQVTISFDLLPEDEWHRSILLSYYKQLYNVVQKAKSEGVELPEIHGTFSTVQSFIDYKASVSTHTDPFAVVSISDIPDAHEGERLLSTGNMAGRHINFNHQIPADICSANIDAYVTKIETLAKVVSSIYLIIHKLPIGKEMTVEEQIRMKNRLTHDLTVMHTLNKKLPDTARAKLVYDGCLTDTAKFAREGHGCSSNVSRVQVWPDGSITGCPYAQESSTGPAESIEMLIDNIRAVRQEYDFKKKCYLPSFYLPEQRGEEVQRS